MSIRTSCRFLLLGALAATGIAQQPPKLNSLSREWVQRGTQPELTVSGENLANATNVVISGAPGVSAHITPPEAVRVQVESSAGGISSVARPDGRNARVSIDIAANAPLTDRELRLVSPDGVSNPLTLRISPLPEVDASKNESRDRAQKIDLPAAINGVIRSAAESDFFRFAGKKGEHVIAEVYAYRLGSRLDSSLAITDLSGKELARNEDAVSLDSMLDFPVPEDGEYLLELRDFRYQGGGDFKYRLVLGVLPFVQRVFPFGAQRGQMVDFALEGVNLDSSRLTLSLAADAPAGRQEVRASSSRGLSNPFTVDISDLPHITEREPNSALDQADQISIPAAVNGRIGAKKDYDAFRFEAGKGQRIIFEVSAFRHGSRLDSLLIVTDATGNVLQRNDDSSGEDARIDYTFKDAGEYFVILEDLLGRGGEDFGYKLTADTPRPDFSATLVRDTPRVRRAGRVPVRCEVNRVNGFDDTVTIICEDLPGGVYAEPLVLPAGVSAGFLMLNATDEAPLGSFPLKVKARAHVAGKTVSRDAESLSNDRPAKQAFLTVLDAAPFSISPATLMANIEQNETGSIEVVIDRRNGFSGEVRIVPEGFSAGREPISRSFDFQPLTLKAGESRGTLSLKTKIDSEIGTRPVVLRGETDGGIVEYSPLLPVATTQIPFVLSTSLKKLVVTALPTSSASAASEAVFNAKIERRAGFEGEVELKLEGVPEGVIASVTNIAAKAGESALKLVATDKAPTGTNVQLTLTGLGMHKDRTYRFQSAPITLSITAPDKEEKKETNLANTQ